MMLSGLGSLQSTAPGFSSVMAIKSAFSSVVCRGRIRRPVALPAGRCGLVGWRIVRFAGGVCGGYRRRQSERIRSLVSIVCCHVVDSVFESSPC